MPKILAVSSAVLATVLGVGGSFRGPEPTSAAATETARLEGARGHGPAQPSRSLLARESTRGDKQTSAPSHDWRPLFDGRTLEGWEETPFGGEGLIHVKDGAIVLEFGEPMTGITYTGELPRVDYELQVEAQRVSGSDFFCGLTFPVGAAHCSLILGGWGGALVGLSNLDGQDASGNETTQYVKFEDGRWYAVRVRVRADRIEAWLDDSLIVDVETSGRQIDVRPEMLLSRPLGIASYRTRAAIREVKVRTIEP